jgi:long-chain acyl-CoA synthetase
VPRRGPAAREAIGFSDALADGANLEFTPVPLEGNDLLFLQYTGGTTGLSKGAALSHRNLVANTEQFKAFLYDALPPGEAVVVTALPLYHIFALMVNFICGSRAAPRTGSSPIRATWMDSWRSSSGRAARSSPA